MGPPAAGVSLAYTTLCRAAALHTYEWSENQSLGVQRGHAPGLGRGNMYVPHAQGSKVGPVPSPSGQTAAADWLGSAVLLCRLRNSDAKMVLPSLPSLWPPAIQAACEPRRRCWC